MSSATIFAPSGPSEFFPIFKCLILDIDLGFAKYVTRSLIPCTPNAFSIEFRSVKKIVRFLQIKKKNYLSVICIFKLVCE